MAEVGIRVVVQGVAEARRNIGAIQSDITGLGRAIESVSGTTSTLGRNLQTVGNAMVGVGRTMTIAVTAPILAMGAAAVTAGISFEAAFADIGKTVEGVMTSTGELTAVGQELREEFRQMALEIPIATDELAELGGVVGQLGVQADQVAEVTEIIAMLGATTNLSAEEAASSLIRFANILNVEAANITDFILSAGSAVVALGNASVSTESEILNLTMRLAAAGDRARFTAPEILAWATTLSDLGVRAEAGGSAVSRAINEMMLAVQTGSDNLGTFASVAGQTVDEFVRAFEEDASGALLNFISGLEEGIRTGKVTAEMLADLGLSGVRAMDILGRLGDAEALFGKNLDIANQAWEEQVALQEEFNKRAATVEAQIQLMKNAFTDLGIEIFDLVKDDITNLIMGIKDVVQWFKDLDPNIQKSILAFAAMAAAIGPVLIIVGGLIAGLGAVVSGIVALLSPVGLATAAVVGLGAVLAALVAPDFLANLGGIVTQIEDIAKALGIVTDVPTGNEGAVNATQAEQGIGTQQQFNVPTLDTFLAGLRELGGDDIASVIENITRIGESLGNIFSRIAESPAVANLLSSIKESFSGVGEALSESLIGRLEGFADFLEEHESSLVEIGKGLANLAAAFITLAGGIAEAHIAILDFGTAVAGGAIDLIFDLIEGDTEGAVENIRNMATAFGELGTALGTIILDTGTALAGSDTESFLATWQGIFDNINTIVAVEGPKIAVGVVTAFNDAVIGAGTTIGFMIGTATNFINGAIMGIGTGIGTLIANVTNTFISAVAGAASTIGSMAATASSFIQSAISAIAGAMGQVAANVSSAFSDAVAAAASFIGSMAATGATFMNAAVDGIAALVGTLISTVSGAISDAVSEGMSAAGAAAGIGSAMAAGIAGAIEAGAGAIAAALIGAVMGAIGQAEAIAGIMSPSKRTKETGFDLIEGAKIGIEESMAGLAEIAATAAQGAVDAFNTTMSAAIGENSNIMQQASDAKADNGDKAATAIINGVAAAITGISGSSSSTQNNTTNVNTNIGTVNGSGNTSAQTLAWLLQQQLKNASAI